MRSELDVLIDKIDDQVLRAHTRSQVKGIPISQGSRQGLYVDVGCHMDEPKSYRDVKLHKHISLLTRNLESKS